MTKLEDQIVKDFPFYFVNEMRVREESRVARRFLCLCLGLFEAAHLQLHISRPRPATFLILGGDLPLPSDGLRTDAASVVVHVAALLTDPRVGQPVLVAVLQESVLPLLLVNPPPVLHTNSLVLAQGFPGVALVEGGVRWSGQVLVDGGDFNIVTANILDSQTGGVHLLREEHICPIEPGPVVVRVQAVVGVGVLQSAEQRGSEEILGLRPDVFLLVEEYIEVSPLLPDDPTVR